MAGHFVPIWKHFGMFRGLRVVLITVIAAVLVPIAGPSRGAAPAWWEGWSMADPQLSQPVHAERIVEPVEIVADDGVRLNALVVRPKVPEGVKVPAIVELSPYHPNTITEAVVQRELQLERYVERGYALVAVSLRGTGSSGGCIDFQGKRDRADIDAIVDTLAGQPWSNGKVGGIGLSWEGTALNAAVVSGNPRLATVVPVASNTDWYLWSYMQGVPAWYWGYVFNLYAGPAVAAVVGGVPEPTVLADRACDTTFVSVAEQVQTAVTGLRDPWWDERDLRPLVEQAHENLAVLQVAGARDEGVRADNLHSWDRAMRAHLPNYRLIHGDWTHNWPDTPNLLGANTYELEANRYPMTTWNVLLLRWFDRWLKDKPTRIEEMPRALLQDHEGRWHGEDGLEPSRGRRVRLYPRPDNGLGPEPVEGSLAFIDDGLGLDPRGTCIYAAAGLFFGCVNATHPNGLWFETGPVDRETRYSGVVKATLELDHTAPRGTVGVTLYDISKASVWTPMTYGIAALHVTDDLYRTQTITPGVPFTKTVEVMVRDIVLRPGHALGVSIGTQVGRNQKGLTGNGYGPVPSMGLTTVHLGEGTHIELNELQGPTPIIPLP